MMDGNKDKEIYRAFVKITKPFSLISILFLVLIFCSMIDRRTEKVNYILDAYWVRKSLQKYSRAGVQKKFICIHNHVRYQ